MYLTVKNVGVGRSYETQANIRNLTGDGLLLHNGRFDISNMNPGDSRQVAFTFDVLDGLKDNLVKVELSVADRDLGVVSSEKVSLPVASTGWTIEGVKDSLAVDAPVKVRGQPLVAARVVGEIKKGSIVDQIGKYGDFAKVSLGGTRFGFVETAVGRAAGARKGKLIFEAYPWALAPLLEVAPFKLASREDHVRVEGVAHDQDQVLDAYVFVGRAEDLLSVEQEEHRPDEARVRARRRPEPRRERHQRRRAESEDTSTRHTIVVRRERSERRVASDAEGRAPRLRLEFHERPVARLPGPSLSPMKPILSREQIRSIDRHAIRRVSRPEPRPDGERRPRRGGGRRGRAGKEETGAGRGRRGSWK